MSQPDQNTALAANEFDPTDAERAALEEGATAAGAVAAPTVAGDGTTPPAGDAAGGDAATAAPGAAGPAAAAPDAAAAAATAAAVEEEAAAAAAASSAPAAPAPAAPAHFVPTYTPESRDFVTEISGVNQQLVDLKVKYKAGDVEDESYEEQYEQLRDERAALERAQDRAQLQAELNQQNSDQSWAYLQRQFLNDAQNAPIAANPLLFAAWATAMEVVVNEAASAGRALTDWDVLVGAREELVKAGMLGAQAATPVATQATPPAKPDRSAPLHQVPQTLSVVPAAADPSSRAVSDAASERGIEDLEEYIAGKSESERDRILKDVPGTFADG